MKSPETLEASKALRHAADFLSIYPAVTAHAQEFRAVGDDLLLPPIVMVMGAFNAGKSTLLNALLGRPLLTTHVLPTTAVVTMLRRSAMGVSPVRGFADGQVVHEGSLASLSAISSEGDSSLSEFRSSLSHIEIGLDLPLLEKFTLIDTPGLNSPFQAHTRATESFTARAKAVVWVTSCLQPLSKFEHAQIGNLPPDIRLLVVVNHIDQIDPEEDFAEDVCQRIHKKLQRSDMKVVGLSAKLALECILKGENGDTPQTNWNAFKGLLDQCLEVESSSKLDTESIKRPLDALATTLSLAAAERSTLLQSMKTSSQEDSDLRSRLDLFISEEKKLAQASNPLQALMETDFPYDLEVSDEVNTQLEEVSHALQLIDLTVKGLSDKREVFDADVSTFNTDLKNWQVEWNECQKSGLFGGEPVFFKGKLKKLAARQETLVKRNNALVDREHDLNAIQRKIKSDEQQLSRNCTKIIDRLLPEVRGTIRALVAKINHGVSVFNENLLIVEGFDWVDTISREIKASRIWGLQNLAQVGAGGRTGRNVSSSLVYSIIETVRKTASDSHSYLPLAPVKTPSSPERHGSIPGVEIEVKQERWWMPHLPVLWISALALPLLTIVGWQFLANRSASRVRMPIQIPEQPLQKAVPEVMPIDDVSAIKLAIQHAEQNLASLIIIVPGTKDPTLRILKSTCVNETTPCSKLFIFSDRSAVWSEDIDRSLTPTSVSAPIERRFDVTMSEAGEGDQAPVLRTFELTATGISPLVDQVHPPEVLVEGTLDDPTAEIFRALSNWAKAMEFNDPQLIAGCYAEQVDRYFLRLNVTNTFVHDYMKTWLNEDHRHVAKFVTNDVTFESKTDTTATLRLVKDVITVESRGTVERFTRSQLSLKKVDGEWRITSERDFE